MRLIKQTIFWLLPFGAHAQLLTNNGAVISSTNGSIVVVNGAVLNQGATGELNNNGTITISGDFTHNAPNNCFGNSAGEVSLNGGNQTIGGSSVAVFNYLELAGTGTKTLLQDAEVGGAYAAPAGAIALNNRNLDLGAHQLTVRNPDPSAITRISGFIISETDPVAGYSFVRWNIGARTGSYVIPFGNASTGAYLPYTATITAAGVGATGYIRMATYPTVTLANPNNRPLPAGMTSLIDVSGIENAPHVLDRWWVLGNGGYTTAPVANTQFTYRDSEWSTGTNTISEPALQLERMTNVWNMMPTVTNITANTLTTNAQPLIPSFWTAAEMFSPLPVELLSFTGERTSDREVQLKWITATERNNAGFEVWRMIEGEEDYAEIGWVAGEGNSLQMITYELPDDNSATTTSYYKLKQVDSDGQFTWTPIVAVKGAGVRTELVAYPNPARDRIMLAGLPDNTKRIVLFDATGRLVRTWNNTSLLDGLGDLERGVYNIGTESADGMTSVRVVLE
ncbi:MAG: T9SS type A sorting domain-containing protein [Flavobacteriales bacterium]|nr:T9SS type A sorting domain-containing protein [Flavobacteriales bacterium]